MDKQSWPAWFYGPASASMICESEADVPAGWVDHPSKVGAPAAETAPAAEKQRTPLAEARIAYKAKFGKAPSPRATLEDLNAKLAEPQPLDL